MPTSTYWPTRCDPFEFSAHNSSLEYRDGDKLYSNYSVPHFTF